MSAIQPHYIYKGKKSWEMNARRKYGIFGTPKGVQALGMDNRIGGGPASVDSMMRKVTDMTGTVSVRPSHRARALCSMLHSLPGTVNHFCEGGEAGLQAENDRVKRLESPFSSDILNCLCLHHGLTGIQYIPSSCHRNNHNVLQIKLTKRGRAELLELHGCIWNMRSWFSSPLYKNFKP